MAEQETKRSGQALVDASEQGQSLRVLVANEREERLEAITAIVEGLGHQVIARETTVETVAKTSRDELPDVALVGLGGDPEHALAMISNVVKEAAAPVIAVLDFDDPDYVNEAAKRGVFAYVTADGDPRDLQAALDITLRRFAEFHNLEGAFGRRAIIEQAKGILMERHAITSHQAFELLRRQSTDSGQKLFDIARAVVDSHLLLPNTRTGRPGGR
jgi:two-component system, response regulator PdtaR